MLKNIIDIDSYLTQLIFTLPHNFILNSFFGFFAVKGVNILIWTVLFLYLVFIEEKKDKRFIFYFIVSLLISSLLVFTMKNVIKRPRPFSSITNYQLLNYPSDYSFPSGHAAISFAAAAILSFFDKKRKKYFYLIAVIIAFSRVYLGCHYVSDVLAGIFLGWLISSLLIKLSHQLQLNQK